MHEYSIVQALLGQVDGHARAKGATAVRRVSVRIGEAAGVEVELLRTAFACLREATICAEAELVVTTVPLRWACPACDRAIPADGPLRCPACAHHARLAGGDEIILERVVMEVADVH